MMLSRTLILAAFVLNLAPAASLARLPAAGDPAERRARLLAEREEARAQTLAPTRGATRPNRSMARTSRVAAFDGTLAPEASVRAHGDFLGYALSPDGQLIAAIPFEKPTAIRIISLGNGELVREIDAFAWRVNALAISPDGQYLIAGGDDGTVDYEYRIKAWTFSSGALVRTFEEWHTDWIRAVDMSADGAYVVSASDDFTVMKWSFATGTRLLTLAGHTDWVRDVDITPDGQRIISASDDNTVRAWQMSDGAPVWTYTGADWIKQADITADGARVGVVYDGSTDAFILDASNGQLLHTLVGVDNWYVSTVAFTGDGLHLLAGMKNGSIRVWNTSTGVFERELSNVHTYDIERLVTGLGDDVALTGSWGLITSIELATGDVIQEIGVGSLMSGAVTPDGRTVVTGSADGRVRLWDRRTGALLRTSNEAHDDWVVALAVSPDGRHIASAGDFLLDYNVKVLRADDLSLVQEMQHEPDETINSMAFTQDGEILVTGTDWPATLAWRVADGAILHESGDHAESVEYVAITPDGMQIVSAGDANGYIAIYDIGTGTRTGTATHGDALRGIGFGEAPASSAQTIYNEDFETGAGGWTNDVAAWVTADWGLGTPTTGPGSAHSASTAWATGLHADYERDAYYSLLSPSITLPTLQQGESIRLTFAEWYDIEADYDSASVWITPDAGGTWYTLAVYDGESGGWTSRTIDLSSFAGETVTVTFDFGSDDVSVEYAGWYIDDVSIEIVSPSQANVPAVFTADGLGGVNAWALSDGSWARGYQLGDWIEAFAMPAGGEYFVITDYLPSANESDDQLLELWEVATETQKAEIVTGHTRRIGAIDFDAEGRYIVTGSQDDQSVRSFIVDPPLSATVQPTLSFDAQPGLPVRVLVRATHHGDASARLAFSVNGSLLTPDPAGLVVRTAFDDMPGASVSVSEGASITVDLSATGRVSLQNDVLAELAFVPAPGATPGASSAITWQAGTTLGGIAPETIHGSYTIPLPRGTRISTIQPDTITEGIVSSLEIRGANFTGASAVAVVPGAGDAIPVTAFAVINDGLIRAVAPSALAQAAYRVRVTAPKGEATSDATFTVQAGASDATPPTVVSDLRIDSTTATGVLLSWTAPTDLNASAQTVPASAYDLRVTTGTLDANNFAELRRVPLAAPQSGGATESVWIAPLEPGNLHFFGLQGVDAVGNRSALSNVAHGITRQDLEPPSVVRRAVTAVSDRQMTVVLETDEPTTARMRVFQAFGGTDTVRVAAGEGALVHRLTAPGLSPGTYYGYQLDLADMVGNGTATDVKAVQTLLVPDNTLPAFARQPFAIARTDNALAIGWASNEPVTAVVRYGASTSYSDSLVITESNTNHIVDITGLEPLTTYHVDVALFDLAGNGPVSSGDAVFNTLREPDLFPPQFVSLPAVVTKDTSRVTIVWTTDEPAATIVEYGVTEAYGHALQMNDFATDRLVVLTNLSTDTRYHYRVRVLDDSQSEHASMDRVFRTAAGPDRQPPVVLESPVVVAGTNDARIQFRTDEPAITTLHYGTSQGALLRAVASFNLVTKHEILVGGLAPGTRYYYLLTTFDAAGNAPVLRMRSFRTPAEADATPPVVVAGPAVVYAANDRVVVRWSTDEVTTGELWYQAQGDTVAASVADGALDWTHEVTITNLDADRTYEFAVVARDVAGNSAVVPDGSSIPTGAGGLPRIARSGRLADGTGRGGTFVTSATADAAPPVVLSGPNVVGRTNSTLSISWETDEAATSIVRYREAGGGVGKLAEVLFDDQIESGDFRQDHLVSLTNLKAGTTYELQVSSIDPAGNEHVAPSSAVAVTLPGVDVTPPQFIGAPTIRASNDRAAVQWQTDEIADSEVIFRGDGGAEQRVTIGERVIDHTVMLTNLQPSTTYHCTVRSADIADNGPSEVTGLTFITAANADTDGPTIVSPGILARNHVASKIAWNTDEPADSYVEYGTSAAYGLTVESGERDTSHAIWLTNLHPSTTYHYRVSSVDMAGNPAQAFTSSFTTAGAPETTPPAVPTGVVAFAGSSTARVTWQGVGDSDLAGYHVYRTGPPTEQKLVATLVQGLAFTDVGLSNLTPYSYRVSALDEFGNESDPSAPSSWITPTTDSAPSAPALDAPSGGERTSRRPVFSASGAQAPASRSIVFYNFIVSRDAALTEVLSTSPLVPANPGGPTSWQLEIELEHDSTYHWSAVAHDGLFSGPAASPRAITADSTIIPLAVRLAAFAAESAPGAVILSWRVLDEGEAAGVVVMRGTSSDGNFEPIGGIMQLADEYSDVTAIAGKTYWYRLQVPLLNGDRREFGLVSASDPVRSLAERAEPVQPDDGDPVRVARRVAGINRGLRRYGPVRAITRPRGAAACRMASCHVGWHRRCRPRGSQRRVPLPRDPVRREHAVVERRRSRCAASAIELE